MCVRLWVGVEVGMEVKVKVSVRARVVACVCDIYTFSSERPPQPGAMKSSVLRLTAWRWHLGRG